MKVRKLLALLVAFLLVVLFLEVYRPVGPVLVRPFDIGLILALFVFAGWISVSGRVRLFERDSILIVFVLLAGYLFVNGLWRSTTAQAVVSVVQYTEFLLLTIVIGNLVTDTSARRLFLKALAVGFAAMAVWVASWHVAHGYLTYYKVLGPAKAAFGLFALFAFYYIRRNKKYWPLFGGAIVLLLLSGERKSWVALAAAVIIVLVGDEVASNKKLANAFGRIAKRGIAIAAGVTLLVVLTTRNSYVEQQLYTLVEVTENITTEGIAYQSGSTRSTRARLYLLHFTIQSVSTHPLFGIGTGQFLEEIRQFSVGKEAIVLGSHSEYQRIAVENGLIGLSIYVLIWLLMIKRGFSLVKTAPPDQRFSALAAFGLAGYGAVINLFLAGGAYNVVYLALPAGLLIGLSAKQRGMRRIGQVRANAAAVV